VNYFVVFQNKTYKEELSAGILWAPQKNKKGGPPLFHWSNMLRLKMGDVVFSICKNIVIAKALVIEPAKPSPNPFNNSLWQRDGWLARVKYDTNIYQMKIADHIATIRSYLTEKYSPFNPNTGRGNVGYLFAISKELGQYIESNIQSNIMLNSNDYFEIDQDMNNIIHELFQEVGIESKEVILVETSRPKNTNEIVYKKQTFYAKKTDFIDKAKRDIAIGLAGEELVVAYEKSQLRSAGREDLAEKVKRISKEADGYGFDILSFDTTGEVKYIEVKTTSIQNSLQPFDVTINEIETSKKHKDKYWVYRIYDILGEKPKFYKINGAFSDFFELKPRSYKAFIK
jgi:hypothetical protein